MDYIFYFSVKVNVFWLPPAGLVVLVGFLPRAAGHEGEGCHRWSPPPAQGTEGVLGCVAGVRGPQAEKEPAERQVEDTGTVQCIPCGECLSRYLLMFRSLELSLTSQLLTILSLRHLEWVWGDPILIEDIQS